MKHLTSLVALLVHQFIADLEQTGEAGLDDFVEFGAAALLGALEAVGTAGHEKTLQAGEDGQGIVGVQQAQCDVHKVGPFAGKVEVEDALDGLEELLSNGTLAGGQNGQYAVPESGLLVLVQDDLIGVVVGLGPAAIRSVLEVNDGGETNRFIGFVGQDVEKNIGKSRMGLGGFQLEFSGPSHVNVRGQSRDNATPDGFDIHGGGLTLRRGLFLDGMDEYAGRCRSRYTR